jgi:hypothetical protein
MTIGTVAGVRPTGRLSPGETVSLEVASQGKNDQPPEAHTSPGQTKNDERKQGKP